MTRVLPLLLLVLLPILYSGCAEDGVEEKEEAETAVALKEGLKRRSPILRPRGFAQFKEQRRSSFLVPVAFFSADSTLRLSLSGKPSPTGPEDVLVLPCVAQRLAQLATDGYYIALISNHPEIGKKTVTQESVDKTMLATVQAILKQGGVVDYFDYADKEDEYLMPETGMGERLERFMEGNLNPAFKIDRRRSFIVGKPGAGSVDRQFAVNLFGPSTPWVPHYFESGAFFGWRRRMGMDSLASVADAKRFQALPDACCDVTHTCADDGKTPRKGDAPAPVYQYPVQD